MSAYSLVDTHWQASVWPKIMSKLERHTLGTLICAHRIRKIPLNSSTASTQANIALMHVHGGVKIGRQTNAKTIPGERNGYFDSKVLSRQHAEVWEEDSKVCLLPADSFGRD